MKKIFEKIKDYVVRVFNALLNRDYYISLTKEEEFYYFLEQNKERIQHLMEFNDKRYDGKSKIIESYTDINGIETIRIKTDLIPEKLKKVTPNYRFRPKKISKSLKKYLKKNEELIDDSYSTGTKIGDSITFSNLNKILNK